MTRRGVNKKKSILMKLSQLSIILHEAQNQLNREINSCLAMLQWIKAKINLKIHLYSLFRNRLIGNLNFSMKL